MDRKTILLGGFSITALTAAVILSGTIPVWAIAMVILVLGTALTFFTAVYFQNRNDMLQLQTIERSLHILASCNSWAVLWDKLEDTARRVVPCQECQVVAAEVDFGLDNRNRSTDIWHDLIVQSGTSHQPVFVDDVKRWVFPVYASPESPVGWLCIQPDISTGEFDWYIRSLKQLVDMASLAAARLSETNRHDHMTDQVMSALVRAQESSREGFTGHGQRVSLIAGMLGIQLGLDRQERKELYWAALGHDMARSCQDPDEEHPLRAARAFAGESSLQNVAQAIKYHHERYDGSGFPEGLRSTEIPFLSRILAAADIYDGLTCLAPPQDRLDHHTAGEVIRRSTGTLFDPMVVVAWQEIESDLPDLLVMLDDDADAAELLEEPAALNKDQLGQEGYDGEPQPF